MTTPRKAKIDLKITTPRKDKITTPRKDKILISKDMVDSMKPGSVIMDLAAENGGNCELTEKDKIINYNHITINGISNIPGKMPLHSSQLYSKNIASF